MKRVIRKTRSYWKQAFMFLFAVAASLAMSIASMASCNGEPENYRKGIVTYYALDLLVPHDSVYPIDQRCSLTVNNAGTPVCRIRLRGILYRPQTATHASKYPVIIVNHGSEETFEADTKFCEVANYFVPKDYIVFAPFRRGQGDNDVPFPTTPDNPADPTDISDKSSGVYVEDMLDDYFGPGVFAHNTTCTSRSCYKAELLTKQADEEMSAAMNYLRGRPDVKFDVEPRSGEITYRIGWMGISYGGAVTVLANRLDLGQKAVVPFSPGAQQWDASVNCIPGDTTCGTPMQKELISAASNAKSPAFYIQAKWDYDTRSTIDLAYAHSYGSNDPMHSRGYQAAIYPYQNPCPDAPCTDEDFQSIHAGFFREISLWGPSVHDFLKRRSVK